MNPTKEGMLTLIDILQRVEQKLIEQQRLAQSKLDAAGKKENIDIEEVATEMVATLKSLAEIEGALRMLDKIAEKIEMMIALLTGIAPGMPKPPEPAKGQ